MVINTVLLMKKIPWDDITSCIIIAARKQAQSWGEKCKKLSLQLIFLPLFQTEFISVSVFRRSTWNLFCWGRLRTCALKLITSSSSRLFGYLHKVTYFSLMSSLKKFIYFVFTKQLPLALNQTYNVWSLSVEASLMPLSICGIQTFLKAIVSNLQKIF